MAVWGNKKLQKKQQKPKSKWIEFKSRCAIKEMKVVSLVLILGNMKSFLWDLCFSFLKIIVKLSWGRKSWVWLEENEGTWRRFLPFPWDYWCRTWCSISGFHCKINFQMFCGCCFQSGLILIFKMFVIFKK